MRRRDVLGWLCASAAAHAVPVWAQRGLGTRPIRLVVPFSAGGTPDVIARVLANSLAKQIGQGVFVENKAGANGIVASSEVAKAAPDGHTLLVATGSHTTNPSIYRKLPYDTVRDFSPVTLLFTAPGLVLVVNPKVPAKTPQEFLELAKTGKAAFGSPGVGNSLHIPGELLNVMAGTKLLHVPFKGASLAVNALLAGDIQAAFLVTTAALPLIKAGQARAIAVTSAKRLTSLPDVPTLGEAAMPGFSYSGAWMGILAPAATPPAVVQRLSTEIRQALRSPEVHEKLVSEENIPVGNTPDEFAKFLAQDTARMAKLVKEANIPPVD